MNNAKEVGSQEGYQSTPSFRINFYVMKASTIIGNTFLALGLIIINFVSCNLSDESSTPVLTRYEVPVEVLEQVFTGDIPKELRNVDKFLERISRNGMAIHEGLNPPEIYRAEGSENVGLRFNVNSDCIYDDKFPANVDSVYGKYEETLLIYKNQQNSFLADVSYASVGDAGYPQYPRGLDQGSGTGYVSGNGNNFTIFYRVENGFFDRISYKAIWIISGTVSNPPNAREITNVTKCLIMLEKGPDPEDKVANRGTVRIFRDESPEWLQSDVVISDFSPTEGPYGTVVTINGSGFSALAEENVVTINNATATILEATTRQLQIKVPKGAGTGPVAIQVINKTATGNVFTYIPAYTVSTLAGTGQAGFLDGMGSSAQFNNPTGVAVDTEGTVYVADLQNQVIRLIDPAGAVSTRVECDDGECFDIMFEGPYGVAVDSGRNIYVADRDGSNIAVIREQCCTFPLYRFNRPTAVAVDAEGVVFVADTGEKSLIWKISSDDVRILGENTSFSNPSGIAVDAQGNVYVADTGNNLIRKITPSGEVSTVAGTAQFNSPSGIAVDSAGNVYVTDMGNQQIRKITPEGEVSILAGTGQAGFLDGIGSAALFNNPTGVAIDEQGNIYVADSQNHRIRKMVLE